MTNNYSIVHVPPSGTTQHVQHAWIASLDSFCVGHIHLQVEPDQRIKFLDAWVHPDYRRKGIFRKLWDIRWKYVEENYKGWKAYAWAKPMSLPLLIEKGFNEGDNCVYVEKNIEGEIPFTFVSC
jgi:GNAT superfamily N-acetyltransferase